MLTPLLTILTLLSTGCGPKIPIDAIVEEPAWATDDGKEEIKVTLAERLISSGRESTGLSLLAELQQEGSKHPDIDLLQALGQMAQGMDAVATNTLEEYVEKYPNDPRPHKALGLLYADAHRVEDAIKAFQTAQQLDPNDASTLNNLGFLLMSTTRYDEAHIAFTKAVGLDSSQVKYWTNMGYNLAAMDRFSEALSAFQGVGSTADAHANLAYAYELNGAMNDAILSYQTALNLDPNHKHAKEGVARVSNATLE